MSTLWICAVAFFVALALAGILLLLAQVVALLVEATQALKARAVRRPEDKRTAAC